VNTITADDWILGAGPTGLGVGLSTGLPILEAADEPGGICRSYFLSRCGQMVRFGDPDQAEVYRFERGGGHWIFGLDESTKVRLAPFTEFDEHTRDAAVYFPDSNTFVPYPIQDHANSLPIPSVSDSRLATDSPTGSLSAWLMDRFGRTLCERFFFPFHHLYTAGLADTVAPQDTYKSPEQAASRPRPAGYNSTFATPRAGLNALFDGIAATCDVRYRHRLVRIDPQQRRMSFADGTTRHYRRLYSTLPLDAMMGLTGLTPPCRSDPSLSVQVLNIGGTRGANTPKHHWLYLPTSRSGFHRVGFYSNILQDSLPASVRGCGTHVSLYVEFCTRPGTAPTWTPAEVIRELADWQLLKDVEVADLSTVDTGYTWSWIDSPWRDAALRHLENLGIIQAGRYARWRFQGMVESFIEGLTLGESIARNDR
jgi:protoporphyrinogen oxidase